MEHYPTGGTGLLGGMETMSPEEQYIELGKFTLDKSKRKIKTIVMESQ